jgi:hypothetical protein
LRTAGGKLVSSKEKISRIWEGHFRKLCEAGDSHSKDSTFWKNKFKSLKKTKRVSRRMARLNKKKLTTTEILEAIKGLPDHKAPGMDGVTNEILKISLSREDNRSVTQESIPFSKSWIVESKLHGGTLVDEELLTSSSTNTMCSALVREVKRIWSGGEWPDEWNCAVVVPIPKKGDLTDPNNYRGISLINTTMKVFAICLKNRLEK